MTAEGEDDDLRNINISEAKAHCVVEIPQIDNPDITAPLKTKQVNIGTEAKLKFAKIGDYRDTATMDKVVELLREYEIFFLPSFKT